jgi:hypothetical protein
LGHSHSLCPNTLQIEKRLQQGEGAYKEEVGKVDRPRYQEMLSKLKNELRALQDQGKELKCICYTNL